MRPGVGTGAALSELAHGKSFYCAASRGNPGGFENTALPDPESAEMVLQGSPTASLSRPMAALVEEA